MLLLCYLLYVSILLYLLFFFFFFSSRRRHTRCYRDWSSDVCSSDLGFWFEPPIPETVAFVTHGRFPITSSEPRMPASSASQAWTKKSCWPTNRSEERRVGKEGRSGGGRAPYN